MKQFLDKLGDPDAAVVVAAMKDVLVHGNAVAHHIRGDINEVRAHGDKQAFRVLYAEEGKHGQVLLALEAISKKTQKLPERTIKLAEKRLADWRARGEEMRGERKLFKIRRR